MSRRWLLWLVVSGIMIAIAAARWEGERPPTHIFRITFGLKDQKATDWNGRLEVNDGEIVELKDWRFEGKDRIIDKNSWQCSTHELIAPGERNKLATPGQETPKAKTAPWPIGIDLKVKGTKPRVTINLNQGKVEFAADIKLGAPEQFLDGQVRVDRLPEVTMPRGPAAQNDKQPYQDDYPCLWIRYKTNRHYLAWVCYQNGKDQVLLAEREGPDGEWSKPIEVSAPGDHFRVAMASTHNDELWVVWSAQVNGNWDLYARKFDISKQLASGANTSSLRFDARQIIRLTTDSGPDIWHRMTTDSTGRAWLVWQGARNGSFKIFARCADADGWHEPIQVWGTSQENEWDPCICADTKEDRVWIGWDMYWDNVGGYAGIIRDISGGVAGKLGDPDLGFWSSNMADHAHLSLACDKDGNLWTAWDTPLGVGWGKNTGLMFQGVRPGFGLYHQRAVEVRIRINGKWHEPFREFAKALPPVLQEFNELPQLQSDNEGRMWLFFRARSCRNPREDGWAAQGRWDIYASAYTGDQWTSPVPVPHSGGRNDMRASSQRDCSGNVYVAFPTDHRNWAPPAMMERNLSAAVGRFTGAPKSSNLKAEPATHVQGQFLMFDDRRNVARVRAYAINHAGKTYRIYRGDLHRHTDISGDGVGDGSLMDLHRYGLDAAALDFILVADHNMGNDKEYPWWRTQKANDLYTIPGKFISMYGYERSVRYPNGHRNVIWTERGHRTLPLPQAGIPAQMAKDTERLYQYLRDSNGICTAHSSATEQGTDWKDFDGTLEPIVELFQGFQCAYEAEGAPLSIDEKTKIVHQGYRPLGFVQNALDKGYKLGFQASSDHVSTHVSYACVLAEEFSRKGLVEAMKKRHTYAATDNIIVDFRCGALGIMGDEVTTAQPKFDVVVIGTGKIDRVEIIRNGKVAHTAKPQAAEARFSWEDANPDKTRTNYYYLRVIQENKHMAWASPIWVKAG